MTAYTIKPLVWDDNDNESKSGPYRIIPQRGDFWWYSIHESNVQKCDSLAHGKQLCQQHWESEAGIGKFLQPYTVGKDC